jgi:hypothetical protein
MKELLNNPETIKNFKLLHYILLSNGVTHISNDFYVDYDGNVDYHFAPWTGKGNAYDIIPNKLFDFLDNFFDNIKDEVLDSLETSDESRATVSCEYSTRDKTFTIDESIQTMGYESYNQEFEIDEKELLEDMVQWKEEGKLKISVDFNGGGDSGYIDEVGLINDGNDKYDLSAVWETKLYNILEKNHGGWEINEGSEGTFIIDNENQIIELDFRMNVEESSTGHEFKHQFEF